MKHKIKEYLPRSPHDIDLWSGGVAERSLPGSLLGPTFSCIIATQFSNVRVGDRYWYELGDQPSSFSLAQLEEIRKSRLARVLCDNTDIIDTIQLYPMILPDHEMYVFLLSFFIEYQLTYSNNRHRSSNPRVSCKSSIIPTIDLSKWQEYSPYEVDNNHINKFYGAKSSKNISQKSPTLVQPASYEHYHGGPSDKNGITVNDKAVEALRRALQSGIYAGEFEGPHRSPLYPIRGRVKPTPTRRPITLSQEYIDNLDHQLVHAGTFIKEPITSNMLYKFFLI